jgi:SAM-dependent methyltransferase
MPTPELAWTFYRGELLKHELADPLAYQHPWRLSTCVATMYVGPGEILAGEVAQMKQAGVPDPRWDCEDESNLLHQRYHLWQWERLHPGVSLRSLDSIVEFGSGYGAMAVVASALGFRGTYYLVDFPEFSDFAFRHLKHRGVNCQVEVGYHAKPDLLVSCFGISEASLQDRAEFLGRIAPASYLLAFQGEWGDIANLSSLESWAQGYMEHGGPIWKVVMERHAMYLVSTWERR